MIEDNIGSILVYMPWIYKLNYFAFVFVLAWATGPGKRGKRFQIPMWFGIEINSFGNLVCMENTVTPLSIEFAEKVLPLPPVADSTLAYSQIQTNSYALHSAAHTARTH